MPIPEAKIRSVKAASNILDLCREYGLVLTKKGEDYFTQCPWHQDDTPSLSISPAQGLFHCFGCGEKGNAFQLVQKMEGLNFPQAFEKVAAKGGKDLALVHEPKSRLREEEVAAVLTKHHAERLQRTLESAFEHMENMYRQSAPPKRYLAEARGLPFLTSLPVASPLKVGYCASSLGSRFGKEAKALLLELGLLREDGKPHFEGCVVFPLCDAAGELRGLYGRKVEGEGTHYYLKGERRGVFGLHDGSFGRGPGSDFVYLTESVIDALSLHQIGIPSVLSLHGVNGFTPVHEAWLKQKRIKTIYLLLDGDKAGREASARLALRLKENGYTCHALTLPEGEDPNTFFSLAAPPRGLSALKALPGYPGASQAAKAATLHQDGEDYTASFGERFYTLRGLTHQDLFRLRVTLRAARQEDPNAFHIDSLDLYTARHRDAFVERAGKALKVKAEALDADLKALIGLLEEERLKLKEKAEGVEVKKVPEMTPAEKAEALAELKHPDLLPRLLKVFEALGVVGEEKAKLLGYVGTVSRLLDKPLGLLIVSRSGAGKTALQNALCRLVPEEDLIQYTRLTGQALFYKGKDELKYKVLAIEEEEGMERALYSVRTLQSSQRLAVGATRTDPKTGKLRTEEYTVEGPVFICIATTNPNALDGETRSRFLVVTVDESEEQTRRILKARAHQCTLEGQVEAMGRRDILKRYHNLQRLLKPARVVNPYMPFLEYSFERLQMRREFDKYIALIEAITLIHQHQRPRKRKETPSGVLEYIEASLVDIALANDLALSFFDHSTSDMAPHTHRLALEIGRFVEHQGGDVQFTRKAIRDFSGWTDWSVRQALEQLVELGYIGKLAGQNGVQFKYELVHDVRQEARKKVLLTDVEELKRKMKEAGYSSPEAQP